MNVKLKLEDQFAFMGGKLIKQHIDNVGNSDQIIVLSPFDKEDEYEDSTDIHEPWGLFLKEIDRAFEKSEEIWKDILHPSY